ncbi:MAG: hypothetical protein U0929_18725 [Planctomycetaceae bacterium]
MVSPRLALGLALSLCVAGCNKEQSAARTFDENKDNVTNTAPPEAHHEHGPNGGHVLELGEEEYHAEVAMDQSRKLTVFLLDEHVKGAKPVENGSVQIVTKVDGNDVTLELVAAPLESEKDGKSSRFELAADKVPGAVMDIEGLTGNLTLKVGDKTLTTSLTEEHDHGHDHGHDHDHEHEHKDEKK